MLLKFHSTAIEMFHEIPHIPSTLLRVTFAVPLLITPVSFLSLWWQECNTDQEAETYTDNNNSSNSNSIISSREGGVEKSIGRHHRDSDHYCCN